MASAISASNLVHSLKAHRGPVNTAVYNTGNSYLLTGGQDRLIKLWNPKSGAEIKSYGGHGYEVLGIACIPDNTKFASCGGDRSVFLWDVATGEIARRFGGSSGHTGKVNAVAFNADASVLASAGYDTNVNLWDMKSQQHIPLQVLGDATDSVTSVTIHGHLIVTGSVDGHVRTYDLRKGQLRTDLLDHPVTSLTLSADSAILLVTSLESPIRTFDLDNGILLGSYTGHKNEFYRSKAGFGVNEASVVFGDEHGKVFGWDTESGNLLSSFQAHDRAILWTACHPKEQEIVTAAADGTVKIWRGRR